MFFLIKYDRNNGKIVSMEEFKNFEREKADDERLKIELELNRKGIECEVVILEAENEQALRRTHRRYFEGLRSLSEMS